MLKASPQRVKETFLALARLNSPPRQERPVADWLIRELLQLGFEVEEDRAGEAVNGNSGNVLARLGGTLPGCPALLFSAHMDTVQPTPGLEPLVEGEVIHTGGRSILGADDKAGIAAILEGIRLVLESGFPRPPVEVAFTVCEEVGLLGALHLDPAWVKSPAAFILDGEGPVGSYIVQAPAQEEFKAEVYGRAAHAGVEPEKGVNAIQVAAEAIACLEWGRLGRETTANVGLIEGGQAVNIVPDRARVRGEVRSHDPAQLEAQVRRIRQSFLEAAARRGAEVEVQFRRSFTSFRLDPQTPALQTLQAAARRIGLKIRPVVGGGGSDANVWNERGVVAVNLGIGVKGEHTPQERASVEQLVRAAELVAALILEWGRP
ncbi:MAG: M20/M25/M40 family metallo-hydrolase [Bacillota bacterium]|nr:M20/M25/M40 family metallo-hydrolase [Bacillota bacterium]